MATYSNWREDLIEVIDTPTTEKKSEKKIKETKVNNKVVINPTFKESVAAMGGKILEMKEVDNKDDKKDDRNVEQKEKAKQEREDKNLKAKEKRVGMAKRMILQKKVQAVRAGAGADITAGYEPEGEMVEASAVLDANKKIGDNEKREKMKKELIRLMKHASDKRADINRESVEVDEGIMKMVKKVIRSKKPEKKAEKAMDAGARLRRKVERKVHAKYVSGSEDNVPDDIREGGYQPEIEHSKLGDAKKKADKKRESSLPPHLQGDAIGKMKKAFATEEDKAFNFVLDKIRKEVGKDGYVSKDNPRKPQSAADKAKVRAHQAKVDKENAAERAKDPSQGRYPKG